MKTHFRKTRRYYDRDGTYHYEHRYINMYRRNSHVGRRRQFVADSTDEDLIWNRVYVNSKASPHHMDPWNDKIVQRQHGKSWKEYTKCRSQWEAALIPAEYRKSQLELRRAFWL